MHFSHRFQQRIAFLAQKPNRPTQTFSRAIYFEYIYILRLLRSYERVPFLLKWNFSSLPYGETPKDPLTGATITRGHCVCLFIYFFQMKKRKSTSPFRISAAGCSRAIFYQVIAISGTEFRHFSPFRLVLVYPNFIMWMLKCEKFSI